MTIDTSTIAQQIHDLRTALHFEPNDAQRADLGEQLRELLADIQTWQGRLYAYGEPGSDPNVEQMHDGRLRITLLQPLMSGQERIETLIMRPPTVQDILTAGEVQVKTSDSNKAQLAKMAAVVATESGRRLAATELHGLLEEESDMLVGALSFLAGRFRRTRKVFKTA